MYRGFILRECHFEKIVALRRRIAKMLNQFADQWLSLKFYYIWWNARLFSWHCLFNSLFKCLSIHYLSVGFLHSLVYLVHYRADNLVCHLSGSLSTVFDNWDQYRYVLFNKCLLSICHLTVFWAQSRISYYQLFWFIIGVYL